MQGGNGTRFLSDQRPADHGKRQVAPALDVSLGEFTNFGIGFQGKGVPVQFFGG